MKSIDTIIGYILIAVGFVITLAVSIWLGFPSPHFNRIAISIALYLTSLCMIAAGVKALTK